MVVSAASGDDIGAVTERERVIAGADSDGVIAALPPIRFAAHLFASFTAKLWGAPH
jgi:hypothetical protein